MQGARSVSCCSSTAENQMEHGLFGSGLLEWGLSSAGSFQRCCPQQCNVMLLLRRQFRLVAAVLVFECPPVVMQAVICSLFKVEEYKAGYFCMGSIMAAKICNGHNLYDCYGVALITGIACCSGCGDTASECGGAKVASMDRIRQPWHVLSSVC